jgi:hypothetical protein
LLEDALTVKEKVESGEKGRPAGAEGFQVQNFASVQLEFPFEVAMHLDRDQPRSAIRDRKAQAMQRRVRFQRRAAPR